jgi:hypothetical protein
MSDNEDFEGQIAALTAAVKALGAILTEDQRNEFHKKLRLFSSGVQTSGFIKTSGDIIRATR